MHQNNMYNNFRYTMGTSEDTDIVSLDLFFQVDFPLAQWRDKLNNVLESQILKLLVNDNEPTTHFLYYLLVNKITYILELTNSHPFTTI